MIARQHYQDQVFAIAMWDWTWLTCTYSGESQENWDRTLDELVERGYNALRIDAFPHMLAPALEGSTETNFRIPPYFGRYWPWGQEFTLNVKPWPALATFIQKCFDREIYIGLSTWMLDDRFTHRRNEIRGRNDLVRIWDHTLNLLKKEGLLDRVIYIDLCNEAPMWMPSVERRVLELAHPESDKPGQWNVKQRLFLEDALNGAVGEMKQHWPNLHFTVSFSSHYDDYMEMNLGNFDLLENHLWLAMNEEFGKIITLNLDDDRDWYEVAEEVLHSITKDRAKWQSWMIDFIRKHKAWADRLGIPVAVTECWGPILWRDHPALSWDWVKDWCAWCVQQAVDNDYWIIATSNFCAPQFRGMWEDITWHQSMTNIILKDSTRARLWQKDKQK